MDTCKVLPFRNSVLFFDDSPSLNESVDHKHVEAQVTWYVPSTEGARWAVSATVIIPPWTPHRRGRTATCASLVLQLSPALLQSTAAELLGTPNIELLGGATADPRLAQLGTSVAEEIQHAWCESLFLEAITQVVAGHLVRGHSRARPRRHAAQEGRLSSRQLSDLRELVESRLECPPSLSEMAGALQLSPVRFVQFLKRSTRLGPHGYVTERRISRARQLLEHSELSLVEIALALGFSSQSHFTAMFHRKVGLTPAVYRRLLGPRL